MATRWKTVTDFPDYEVSTDGRVRSWRPHKQQPRKKLPHYMTGFTGHHGYHAVMLRRDDSGKPHRRLVHRLVAMAFIPNPKKLRDVAHNDGNPSNNTVKNLRWATHADNQMDMRRHGTMQDGEKSCTCKLTESEVLEIMRKGKKGKRGIQRALAKKYNVHFVTIHNIIMRKTWKYLS